MMIFELPTSAIEVRYTHLRLWCIQLSLWLADEMLDDSVTAEPISSGYECYFALDLNHAVCGWALCL
jgi:hypothetical protein